MNERTAPDSEGFDAAGPIERFIRDVKLYSRVLAIAVVGVAALVCKVVAVKTQDPKTLA